MKLGCESMYVLTPNTTLFPPSPHTAEPHRGSSASSTQADCCALNGGPQGCSLIICQGWTSSLHRISLLGQSLKLQTSLYVLCNGKMLGWSKGAIPRRGPGRGHRVSFNEIFSSEGEAPGEAMAEWSEACSPTGAGTFIVQKST